MEGGGGAVVSVVLATLVTRVNDGGTQVSFRRCYPKALWPRGIFIVLFCGCNCHRGCPSPDISASYAMAPIMRWIDRGERAKHI